MKKLTTIGLTILGGPVGPTLRMYDPPTFSVVSVEGEYAPSALSEPKTYRARQDLNGRWWYVLEDLKV
jgi:hypothetical protein